MNIVGLLTLIEKWTVPEPNTGCLLWTRALSNGKDGYPVISYNRKKVYLHRWLVEQKIGRPLRTGKQREVARHAVCGTSICLNINHLEVGTDWDNAQDTKRMGRTACGEKLSALQRGDKHWTNHLGTSPLPRGSKHHCAKITEADVLQIRSDVKNGIKVSKLALKYKLDKSTIYDIINKNIWKHI